MLGGLAAMGGLVEATLWLLAAECAISTSPAVNTMMPHTQSIADSQPNDKRPRVSRLRCLAIAA